MEAIVRTIIAAWQLPLSSSNEPSALEATAAFFPGAAEEDRVSLLQALDAWLRRALEHHSKYSEAAESSFADIGIPNNALLTAEHIAALKRFWNDEKAAVLAAAQLASARWNDRLKSVAWRSSIPVRGKSSDFATAEARAVLDLCIQSAATGDVVSTPIEMTATDVKRISEQMRMIEKLLESKMQQ